MLMRLYEIENLVTESMYKIVEPLTVIANEIVKQIPSNDIDINEEIILHVTFSETIRDKVAEYGSIFYSLCEYIEKYIPIYLVNQRRGGTLGSYQHFAANNPGMDNIFLYIPTILSGPRVYSQSELQSIEIENVLVHEIRHVMQRQQFSKFYHKMAKQQSTKYQPGYSYQTDPIEIDAAFIQQLHRENSDNITDFVNGVMKRFSEYKKLTHKQITHYRKKAATYYHATIQQDIPQALSPKMRLAQARQAKLDSAINQIITTDISALNDLRNVNSKQTGTTFLINPNQYRSVLLGAIKNEIESKLNIALGISFLGFMKKINPEIDAKTVLNNMNTKLTELLSVIKDADLKGMDKKLFIDSIKSLM
jgi:hypothetical protein